MRAALRLKTTLLPMLQEEGLHIQERQASGTRAKELDAVLVDCGVFLLNGKSHPHGYRGSASVFYSLI